jgi:hypothetical protein
MRKIRLVGMGVVGSIIARKLEAEGIDFCWFDPEVVGTPVAISAWKASTGCIYPSGDKTDKENYSRFEESARLLGMEYEVAEYCFSQNSIPHHENDKTLKVVRTEGDLKFLNLPSFHVNVQKFVESTREKFKDRFSAEHHKQNLTVITHGFHQAAPTDYRWGWSAPCSLEYSSPRSNRLCMNLKEGRFNNSYIYPKHGTNEFYIGTHFIYQKTPKMLSTDDKIKKIFNHIQSKVGSYATIAPDWSRLVHGWRPAYIDDNAPDILEKNGLLYLKPQMANGLRHHVLFSEKVIQEIKDRVNASTTEPAN